MSPSTAELYRRNFDPCFLPKDTSSPTVQPSHVCPELATLSQLLCTPIAKLLRNQMRTVSVSPVRHLLGHPVQRQQDNFSSSVFFLYDDPPEEFFEKHRPPPHPMFHQRLSGHLFKLCLGTASSALADL